MKKGLLLIVVFVVAGLVAVGFLKDVILKSAVTTAASAVLGTKVTLDSFALSIPGQSVKMKGLKVYQPSGYPSGILADMPEIAVALDVAALLKQKIHCSKVVFNLKEAVLIKNKEGVLNVESLKVIQQAKEQAEAASKTQEASKPSAEYSYLIEVLSLNIGKVIVKDYSEGDNPAVLAYDVNLRDKEYKNITQPGALATIIMAEALGPTALRSAAIYGATTVLGVAFLPAGVAGVILSKDDASEIFSKDQNKVYESSLAVLKEIGKVSAENKEKGQIKANVYGCDITVQVNKQDDGKTLLTVTARKMMLPKAEIAGGVLYQIATRLK